MTGNFLGENLLNKFRNIIGFRDKHKNWGILNLIYTNEKKNIYRVRKLQI